MVPSVGSYISEINLIKVVFPDPLGPIRAIFSPAYKVQFIEFKANTLFKLFFSLNFPPQKLFKIFFLIELLDFKKIGILNDIFFKIILGSNFFVN